SQPASGFPTPDELQRDIDGGLRWLVEHQNDDGGWGDTTLSFSNISTSVLCHAAFHGTGKVELHVETVRRADAYIQQAGGIPAILKRYGKDQTFSVPILTHCALAGLVDWKEVSQLPFELSCIPAGFYAAIRLPVVSYALPALIAIGQVRHHFQRSWNPFVNWLRDICTPRSLRILKRIQPPNGGFLEATPLTSFVTMSLAAKGLLEHPVVERGVSFLRESRLEDGSWPIDTNLATWVTTMSVNALGTALPDDDRPVIREWLLGQQYQELHRYTNAAPGGWAWTDLPGGVPDADDTPGAIIALGQLESPVRPETFFAQRHGLRWLLGLQNRDGGWPTFCQGWANLPFDRSSCDITAHVLRACVATCPEPQRLLAFDLNEDSKLRINPPTRDWPWFEVVTAIRRGMQFLTKHQQKDGSWLPLWFGNQYAPDDINPTYGTAKVLAAYRDLDRLEALPARDGIRWLRAAQNDDGGWGGVAGAPSSVEETALATEILLSDRESIDHACGGLDWLLKRIDEGRWTEPSPIGFYFFKLWYFEKLYPMIWTVAALRRAVERASEK
ncbi:MAG: squalene--hopene cyclase, partial [Planctomycetaceae bacterium]|nr:squalene--hopene cyclase [Planctomycetaceae bacterium]